MKKYFNELNISKTGFTITEILLLVVLIAMLTGIVFLSINPGKRLADVRNSQRKSDVDAIMGAIYQYAANNNGAILGNIKSASACPGSNALVSEICKTGINNNSCTDLSALTENLRYLESIPVDPISSSVNGSGYNIIKTSNGKVTVCAPLAENMATVSASR